MSDSKKRHPARWLRLERLESRSLLAAGVFDFTVDDSKSQRDHDTPNQEDRRASDEHNRGGQETRSSAKTNPDGNRQVGLGQDRGQNDRRSGSGKRDGDFGREDKLSGFSDRRDFVASEQLVVDQVKGFETPSLNNPIANSLDTSFTPTAQDNDQAINLLVGFSSRGQTASDDSGGDSLAGPRSNDGVLTSLPNATDDREPAINDAINGPNNDAVSDGAAQDAMDAVQFNETLDSGEVASLTPTQPSLLRASSDVGIIAPKEFEGLVELTPLGQWQMLEEASEAASESWQLDRSILPSLKQTLEATSEAVTAELAELADTVVDQLFGNGGGMVAIDQVQLPRGLFEIERAFVDVQVESTVMLFRSLDLFASSDIDTHGVRLSGPILDAIMATLGEVAESETQPIGEPASFRLSAIAYPIAAVAATGAAFSARSKSNPLVTSRRPTRTISL